MSGANNSNKAHLNGQVHERGIDQLLLSRVLRDCGEIPRVLLHVARFVEQFGHSAEMRLDAHEGLVRNLCWSSAAPQYINTAQNLNLEDGNVTVFVCSLFGLLIK